ncbi:MAG: hypothetical protein JWN23_105 [Rhodocyclales bacterium]|nr:hypothetical protein [Rhodocyclales bacterium]
MKQEQFEQHNEASWQDFEEWLKWRHKRHAKRPGKDGKKGFAKAPFPSRELPERYRIICLQLALARDRDYTQALVEHLHRLAQLGHDVLYGAQSGFTRRVLQYAAGGFATDVRANAKWVLASALLFFGPMLAAMLAVHLWPDFAYLMLSPEQVAKFESMYGNDSRALGRVARDASTDFHMFGFYVYNNVSIAFRCFAGGLTAGVLTVFYLIYNGLSIGVVAARLGEAGLAENFYSFVVGHSTFELGAIVLSGAAGLKLGAAILAPHRMSRGVALRQAGRSIIGMVCGLAVMLFAAALTEAFWSPLKLGLPIKLTVGGVLCALSLAYFTLAGRRDGT